jgi:hypothetical protein
MISQNLPNQNNIHATFHHHISCPYRKIPLKALLYITKSHITLNALFMLLASGQA